MWELDHKEGWVLKNWCFPTVELEKTLENPLDSMEIKPVHPKDINLDYSLGELTLKLQYSGHLILRANLLEDPDAGKDWKQKEKRVADDEKVR